MISSHAWSLSHSFATGCVQRLVQVLLPLGENLHSHNFQQASHYGINHQGMIEEVSSMTRVDVCTTPLQCFATKKPNKHSTSLVNSKCLLCLKVEEVVSSSRVDLLHATNSRAKPRHLLHKKGEKVSECQAAASVVLPWDVTQEVMRSMHQCCQLVPNAQTVSISIHTLTADLGCKVPARNQKNITHFVPTRNQTQMSTSAFCQPIWLWQAVYLLSRSN
jgi:hypothetical protein